MAITPITNTMIEREIAQICKHLCLTNHLNLKLLNFGHDYLVSSHQYTTCFIVNKMPIWIRYKDKDLNLSLDDFCEKILLPQIKPYLTPDHLFLLEECS